MDESLIYGHAQRIACLAMGKKEAPRKRDRGWKANDDPLAFALLTEMIFDLAIKQKTPQSS